MPGQPDFTSTILVEVVLPTVTAPLTQSIVCGDSALLYVTCAPPGVTFAWTPTTGPAVPGNPATVAPATTTTYTLSASLNGQPVPVGQPNTATVTVKCCPPHEYVNKSKYMNLVSGGLPYEIGEPTRLTVIDGSNFPGGAPQVFDGSYHVRGPLLFQNGDYQLAPGTTFYMDGGLGYRNYAQPSNCYNSVLGNRYIQVFVGDAATLTLEGATLTANCDEMWGGVEIVENGTLRTLGGVISEARVGVLVGTECRSTNAQYQLKGTTFFNDTYGVVVQGNGKPSKYIERFIRDCEFFSNPRSRLIPDDRSSATGDGDYTRTGLVLHGDFHDGIYYVDNQFHDLFDGAEVAGGDELRLTENKFWRNYGAAVVVGEPTAKAPVGTVVVEGNEITVPDDPAPGGQVAAGQPVTGIRVLALPNGGRELYIETNDVGGQSGQLGVPGKDKTGLDAQLSFDRHHVQKQNLWSVLDIGVQLMDAGANTSHDDFVTDNYFTRCTEAVVLTGGIYASYDPIVSCNTFEGNRTSVAITPSSTVGVMCGPTVASGFALPVSNQYLGSVNDLGNDGVYQLVYVAETTPPENPTYGNPSLTPIFFRTSGTPCSQRQYSYGTGVFGLNRPAAGAAGAND